MNDYLSKLKEDIFDKNKIKFGSTLSELYKIKNIAMTQYTFLLYKQLVSPWVSESKDIYEAIHRGHYLCKFRKNQRD